MLGGVIDMCVLGCVIDMCVRGVDVASFYDFAVGFCSFVTVPTLWYATFIFMLVYKQHYESA